jgi:hypothetical protein
VSNSDHVTPSISITTDKPTYIRGDIITVSGHVTNPIAGEGVVIMGVDPSLDDIFATPLSLDNNGNYATKINTTGPLMAENGQYEILAQYHSGQGTLTVQTQFTVTGNCLGSQCSAPTNATAPTPVPPLPTPASAAPTMNNTTSTVPEFGFMPGIVLIFSIIGLIVMSRKFRFL